MDSGGVMVTAACEPHLEAGAQVVARAVTRLRLRARRRMAWLRSRSGVEAGAAPGAGSSSAPPLHTPLDPDDLEAEYRFDGTDQTAPALTSALAEIEEATATDMTSALYRLARIFTLDRRELDYVEACLAIDSDPSVGHLLGGLADDAARGYATEPMLARLYDHGLHRVLTPESPLARWRLVRAESIAPGEAAVLTIDPLVRDWLVDQRRLDGMLIGIARLTSPRAPLPRWPVDATAAWMHDVVTNSGCARVRVIGSPGAGRRTFAACVAEHLGLPLLALDTDAIPDDAWPDVVLAANRQAFLDGCALAWIGDGAMARRWPDIPALFPIQFLVGEVGPIAAMDGAIDQPVEMPSLAIAERVAMWRHHLPPASVWAEEEIDALAAHHRLTPGEIKDVAARRPATAAEASDLVRVGSRHRLGELARWMESPFVWDDLIVPRTIRDALEDLVYEARHRATFWEQPSARRLFPQGRGLFALFTGNPGTGKTMAAQVVASALGLDLFRISLASVVSKYVGETSKNLQRILARAEAMDAVLLFDEADALFGKRTDIKDAHDRFANTDTNYLLQAIEAYRGIALLASNKKANIDPAFTRRLRWVLEFPRPDAAQRRALWTRLIDELVGPVRSTALSPCLAAIADTVEVTGAQIKYAILAALFAARRDGGELEPRHLARGLERELLKEGRALSDRDRQRLGDA
jgi:adenylate kinase family enzyme